jgi:hypothetical protein
MDSISKNSEILEIANETIKELASQEEQIERIIESKKETYNIFSYCKSLLNNFNSIWTPTKKELQVAQQPKKETITTLKNNTFMFMEEPPTNLYELLKINKEIGHILDRQNVKLNTLKGDWTHVC